MDFDKKIIDLRKKNNLTQEEFADKLNVSRQTVSNWETGKCYPDIATLVLLSNKFNISLDALIKDNIDMIKDIDNKIRFNKKLKCSITLLLIILIISAVLLYINNIKMNYITENNYELQEEIEHLVEIKSNKTLYSFKIDKISIEKLSINNKYVDIYINNDLIMKDAQVIYYYDKNHIITNDINKLEFIILEIKDAIYPVIKQAEINNDLIILKNIND